MQKKNILISVIDGQGGGIGRQYISALTSVLPKDLPVTIRALGTNSLATSNMLKGGANDGATGENAIIYNASRMQVILGPVAILVGNGLLGELTPAMAAAVGGSDAVKILLPSQRCNIRLAVGPLQPMQVYLNEAIAQLEEELRRLTD